MRHTGVSQRAGAEGEEAELNVNVTVVVPEGGVSSEIAVIVRGRHKC